MWFLFRAKTRFGTLTIFDTSSLIFIYQRNIPKGRPSAQRRRGRTLDTPQAVLALATDQRESPQPPV